MRRLPVLLLAPCFLASALAQNAPATAVTPTTSVTVTATTTRSLYVEAAALERAARPVEFKVTPSKPAGAFDARYRYVMEGRTYVATTTFRPGSTRIGTVIRDARGQQVGTISGSMDASVVIGGKLYLPKSFLTFTMECTYATDASVAGSVRVKCPASPQAFTVTLVSK